jgi:hypothetical protein
MLSNESSLQRAEFSWHVVNSINLKGGNPMSSFMNKTLLLATVVSLLGISLASAGSVNTFKRPSTHSESATCSAALTGVAESNCCRFEVAENTRPSVPDAKVLGKTDEKAAAPVAKTVNMSSRNRSVVSESERYYSAPTVRRSYDSTLRNNWGGFSHDRAMAAKGYYTR